MFKKTYCVVIYCFLYPRLSAPYTQLWAPGGKRWSYAHLYPLFRAQCLPNSGCSVSIQCTTKNEKAETKPYLLIDYYVPDTELGPLYIAPDTVP